MRTLPWYFDFVSPFAYLQSRMLHKFEGRAALKPVPVLFAGLLNHWGHAGPAELAPKRVWTYRYCTWYAHDRGIPFVMPPRHPFNPLKPLRLAVALGAKADAIRAIFDFIWAEGRDPSDPVEWFALATRLGLADADRLVERPKVKDTLRANTEKAIAQGVFGVPSIVIGKDLFWGVDGTDFALQVLDNPALLKSPAMKRIASLPAGADRRPPVAASVAAGPEAPGPAPAVPAPAKPVSGG